MRWGVAWEADQVQPGSLWRRSQRQMIESEFHIHGAYRSTSKNTRAGPGTEPSIFPRELITWQLSCLVQFTEARPPNQDGVSYFENSCHLCVPPPFHSAGPLSVIEMTAHGWGLIKLFIIRPKSICIDCPTSLSCRQSHTNNSLAGDVIQPAISLA